MHVIINITKALKYLPVSKSTSKNSHRSDVLYELAVSRKSTIDVEETKFAIYIAKVIRMKFEESIKTQKVNGKSMNSIYQKLSTNYNNTKPKKSKDKFWINSGELVKRIRVWKSHSGVNIGFPPDKKHPHSEANLIDILGWMENGSKRTPARPLFKPIVLAISKNIDAYFQHYIKTQVR